MKRLVPALVGASILVLSLAHGGYAPGLYAAVAVLAWWTVIIGVASGGWPLDRIPAMCLAAGACLAGLSLLSGISIAWASDDGAAFTEAVRAAGYAGVFALVAVSSRRDQIAPWIVGLALGMAAVAVLALGSRLEPSWPGGDQELAQLLPGTSGRLSYPIGYWNGLAACMALGAVACAWLGSAAETRLGRSLAIAALPSFALVIYLCSSRGGFAAAIAGLITLLALGPDRLRMLAGLAVAGAGSGVVAHAASIRTELLDGLPGGLAESQGDELLSILIAAVIVVFAVRWGIDSVLSGVRAPRRVTQAALAGLAAVIVVGVVIADPARRVDEFKDTPEQEQLAESGFTSSHLGSSSGSGRYQLWSVAIDAFEESPVEGLGAGGYGTWWNRHAPIPQAARDAHSLFLESLAELGIPGGLLVIGFLGLPLAAGALRVRSGTGAGGVPAAAALVLAGVTAAAVDWTWELPAAFLPVVMGAALLSGPAGEAERGEDRAGRGRFGWGVATLLFGWVAMCAAGLVFLTQVKLDDSHDAVRSGDLPSALTSANDAISLQPWAAESRTQKALVQEAAGETAAARATLAEAIDRSEEDWSLWLVAARLDTQLGRLSEARSDLARAGQLNPNAVVAGRPLPGQPTP